MRAWIFRRALILAALVLSSAVVLARPSPGAEVPAVSERGDGAPFWSSAFFELDFGDGRSGGGASLAEAEIAASVQSADDGSVARYARSLTLAMSSELSEEEAFSLGDAEVVSLCGALEIDLSDERDWHQNGVFRFHGRVVEGSGCILFFDPRSGVLLGRHASSFRQGDFDVEPPPAVLSAQAARAAAESAGACESDRSTRVRDPVYSTRLRRFVVPVVAAVEPHRIDSQRAGDEGYLDTLTYRIDSETGVVLDVERFHLHGEVSGRTVARQPEDRRGTSFFSERVERPVPRVSLRYEHPALDAPVEAVSSDDGHFRFADVPDAGTIVAVTRDEELLLIKQVLGGGREDPEMARVSVPEAAVPGARVTVDLDLTAPEGTRDRLARTVIWTALKKASAFDRRLRPQHPLTRTTVDGVQAVFLDGQNAHYRFTVNHSPTSDGTIPRRGIYRNFSGLSVLQLFGGTADFGDEGDSFALLAHEKGHEVLGGLTGIRFETGVDVELAFAEAFAHLFGWLVVEQERLDEGGEPQDARWAFGMEAGWSHRPMFDLWGGMMDPFDGEIRTFDGLVAYSPLHDQLELPEMRMLPVTGLWVGWLWRIREAREVEIPVEIRRENGQDLPASMVRQLAWQEAIDVVSRTLYLYAALYRADDPAAIPKFTPETARVIHFLIPWVQGATIGHQELFEVEAVRRNFTPFRGEPFVRGDANLDGFLDVSDAVRVLLALFSLGQLFCHDAADTNDDGLVDLSDPILTLTALYGRGVHLPGPSHGQCGRDWTIDSLGCREGLAERTCE